MLLGASVPPPVPVIRKTQRDEKSMVNGFVIDENNKRRVDRSWDQNSASIDYGIIGPAVRYWHHTAVVQYYLYEAVLFALRISSLFQRGPYPRSIVKRFKKDTI